MPHQNPKSFLIAAMYFLTIFFLFGLAFSASAEEQSISTLEQACQPNQEICDGLDNDCDGLTDEDLGQTACGAGACEMTMDNCSAGVPQTCAPKSPTQEICDQKDNDCDGETDEGNVCETSAPSDEPTPEPLPFSSEPNQEPLSEPVVPEPTVQPVVPFVSQDGRAFDPAIAPSKVKIKILDPEGNVPKTPVFVSFAGVGGRTYGGQINTEGVAEAIMPTGRYETDFLIIDTKLGPPAIRLSFFLEPNEDMDFGVFLLTNQSSFYDKALEEEMAGTLGTGAVGNESQGALAKIFSLIVKLLLAILQEIRSLRSEMLVR